ncbi:translin-like [Argiope bruennichi]|uniref:Translin n=1 Tax=Argiope bruennichi TaxID=94029 RepID=A0A8T0E5V8_ARGBR|nr:translin-like [Argiope bruennichi]KAF8766728.1 Translin like protein [Argiope bruennichi]
MTQNYFEIFSVFQKYMEDEEAVRDSIKVITKELDQTSREIITMLQGVHKPKGLSQISILCQKAREQFSAVKKLYASLQEKVPTDEFYRYHEHWRFVTQRLVFSAAFIVYLESGKLIGREEAAELLGISPNPSDPFHVELDDFLIGLLLLAEELTRLSLNCATYGEYNRPIQIAEFVSEMNVGFRLLNLKNDLLRKKFDGLKYNLKKVEEVVYDLSIRGLIPVEGSQGDKVAKA